MSVYNRQNQEFVPLAETSGILQNMTSSNIEYVVCADGETPEYNTGIRLSPSKKLKFSQNVGVSYVRVVGNTTGDIIVTPNDEASSGGGSTTRIINHVQDWQPDTLYPTGTLVIYNNVLYKCVVPNHKTIFDPADWVVIGAGNDSGKGISVWNSQTNYKVDDIILHGNTLYVCVNEHVSSTEFGDDTEYWVVITDNAGTVLPDWQAREKYEKDEIVNVGGFIYRCKSPHISRDTFATMNDVVGDEDYWELISWVDWHTETQYLKDQIVYHDGALWRCLTNHVSDNTSISNDSDKWIKICGYTLPVASVSGLGGIKVGNGLTITDDGTLSTNAIEVVKVNNEPLPLDDKSVNIDLTDYVRSNDITAVLHYKGTKQDYNDLPIAGNIIGDVWNIVNSDTTHSVKAGDNVAWNGSTWDVLSGTVDLSGYVIKEIGKGLSTEDFTSVLKAKLEGIETGANAYTLPIATENILGGVKVGSGLSISNDGILSVEFAPNNDIVTWVAGTAYNVGQYVIYNNNLYECKTANNDASFDETKWQLIGASGGNFQITDWESGETYAVGDLVIYNDVLYQCTTANSDVSFDSDKWTSIGEPERDLQQWESGKSYRVGHFVIKDNKLYQCTTANSDTTFDATKWTEIGDMSDIQAWESGTSYSANDYVIYDNRVYKCTTANSDTTFTASNWQDMGSIQSYITEWHSGKAYTVGTLVIKDKAIYKCTTANSDLTFTPSKWEKQIDSDKSLTAWVSGTSYKAGQYVVYQGKIYECTTANNDVAFDDTKWSLINEATGLIVDSWKTKTVYKKNQIIEYIGDMYMCLVGHTSDSFKEDYDSEHWLKVDHSIPFYQDNTFYPKDSVVSYEGKLLRCLVSHSSSSDSPFNADFFSKSWASQDSDNVLCYSTSRDSTMARMNTPKSINLDLGNEFTSSSIRITIKHYTARVHFNDISVYVSNDNTNFESVGTAQISGYVNKTYNFAFLEKTFRYIRIGASGATPWNTNIFGSYSGWTIVSKVEVFQDNSNKWEILAGEEYNLPIATENILGGVKVGSGLSISNDGILSVEFAPNNDIVTWVAGTAYNVGQYVIYNNNLYECKTANNDASFDETKWQLIGASGGNFQITDWESGETYAVGDLVIYNDVLYQCTTANSDVSFDSDKWTSIGEPERDLQQWESGKSYRVGHFVIKDNKLYQCTTANSDTTFDATKWTEIGDMSDIQAWESGTSYSANDYVIYDNRVYKCTTANSDTTFTASNWQDMGSIQSYITEWHSGKAYTVGTLVIKDKAIYKCTTANSDLTFTPSKWEKQIDSDKSLTAWVSGTSYKAGQYVVYQGKIYECTTANNDVAFDDTKWSLINEATGLIVDSWKTKTVYKKNQIIEYIGDMYMCLVGHTSDSFKEDYDSEHWLKVDHSIPFYQDNTFYPKDSVVSYEGKLLRCLVSHSSSSDSPFNADFFSKSWASQDSDNVLCYSTSRDSTMARMNTPKSINLDLGNEFTSSSIRITIKHYTARVHFNDISVYVSNDNTNFESVGTAQISGYVNKTYNFAFLEKTFRYIRIGASGATPWNTNIFGSYSGWTIVSKVEVFQDNSNKWEILAGEEYNLPIATENILGGVKVGSNITINANGTISLTRDNITNALGYTPPEQDTDTTYPAVTYLENGLMLADDKKMLDYIVNTYWKPSTAYAVGATANHYALPPSYYLECTTPGTTGATAPVITSVTAGDTITDGSVVWTVRQCLPTSGGTMTGDIATNSGIVFSDFTKILDIGTTPNTAPLIVLSNPKVRLIGGNRESVNAGKCLIMAGKPGNTFNPYLGISPDGSAFYSPVGASAQEYDLGGSAIVAKSLGTYGGYIKRASGEILQFGYNSVNGAGAGNINSKEITFPISFSTAPIVVANVQTSYPNDINSSADKINASKFSFYLSGGTLNYGYGVLWFAIGI